jgi:hypothetical protein
MGSSITSTLVATPLFWQSPAASIRKNCKSPKQNLKGWNLLALFAFQLPHGHPLCTWFLKKKNVDADFFVPTTPPPPTGTVAATAAADTVDFEEMATEQNHCPELQRLLGGTSLKLHW